MIFMSEKKIDALNTVSIEEFLLRYTESPESRAPFGMLLSLFFVLPPWQVSAGEAIWNIRKFFREPSLYSPKGGAVAIPKTILNGAVSHGAQVRLNERVKRFSVSDGRVKGVIMENGELITAHAVISTTSLKDTVFSLAGKEHFPPAYVKKIKMVKGSWAPVQAKIAVRKKLVDAGSIIGGVPLKYEGGLSDEIPRDYFANLEDGKVGEMINIYAPIPTNFDPGLAPKGCQIITAAAAAPTLDIMLKDEPSVWIEGMMNALYQIIPGLKENIIFCDTWSVKNIASWMGKFSGSAITTAQTIDQVGVNRPDHRTPVRGLYIAGDCGGRARGVGTELACQSGMDCGDLVAGGN
jgi:prolycopene isomerase